MIDLNRAADKYHKLHPDVRWPEARERIERLAAEVRREEVPPGNFFYVATGGLWVQKIHYTDDGEDAVRVFVEIACDYDEDDDDL